MAGRVKLGLHFGRISAFHGNKGDRGHVILSPLQLLELVICDIKRMAGLARQSRKVDAINGNEA